MLSKKPWHTMLLLLAVLILSACSNDEGQIQVYDGNTYLGMRLIFPEHAYSKLQTDPLPVSKSGLPETVHYIMVLAATRDGVEIDCYIEGGQGNSIYIPNPEELYRMAFMRFVKEADLPYDYTEASSITEALRILSLDTFDIILADYSLGDGTALDVLNFVKNNTPVIVITGAGDEQVAVNAWKAGASDYLVKDFERNYLDAIPITIAFACPSQCEEHTRVVYHT